MLPEPMSGSYDCARAGGAMMIAAHTTAVSPVHATSSFKMMDALGFSDRDRASRR